MMNTINNFDDALSTFEDFDFDINDSDELIISPTTNNSSTISESDLVGSDMLFMVDEVTPPFINSSFSVMTKNPSSFLPTMMNNNKLDAYAFNPSESAIVKDDESVVSDLYFDSPSTPPLPPYPKKKRQKIHDHRRVTVDSSGAPSLSDLFGNNNNNNNASPQVIKKKTTTTKSYHTALKNLAESMKRSQLSRRQVAMQSGQVQDENQAVISSTTKVLSSIEEQLQHGSSSSLSSSTIRSGNTSPVFSSSSSSVLSDQSSNQNTSSSFSSSSNHSSMNSLSHDKSSIMKDFFSGTRNTLTDGLENSRNQLRMLASAAAYPYDCNSYVMKRQSSCLYWEKGK